MEVIVTTGAVRAVKWRNCLVDIKCVGVNWKSYQSNICWIAVLGLPCVRYVQVPFCKWSSHTGVHFVCVSYSQAIWLRVRPVRRMRRMLSAALVMSNTLVLVPLPTERCLSHPTVRCLFHFFDVNCVTFAVNICETETAEIDVLQVYLFPLLLF